MTAPIFHNMPELGTRIRQARHLLVGLDYDGTLTPIVDEPARALLPNSVRQTIAALTRRDGVAVALVSGRAQADLQAIVGVPGVIYAGNHGMEISGPGLSFIEPGAKAWSRDLHALGQEITSKLRTIQGASVEDKGLTLSVHHRLVPPVHGETVWHVVYDAVKPYRDRFQIALGDKVYEIRPLVSWNKGSAMAWIKEKLNKPEMLTIYIGDDATDEDAFRALGDEAVTIRVADHAQTAAQLILSEPAAVQHFLQWVNELREQSEGNGFAA
jgi:trehalose 6-phosphate phosphatase